MRPRTRTNSLVTEAPSARPLSRVAALALALVAACDSRRGGGDDDDSVDGDDDAAVGTAETYGVREEIHIVPSDVGQMLGLSECDLRLDATVSRDEAAAPCEGCEGVWTGPVQGVISACSGVDAAETLTFGFAGGAGGLRVFEPAPDGTWKDRGTATWDGAAFGLGYTEAMLAGEIELGDIEAVLTFTPE